MVRIGITGSNGFIGWHLRAFLYPKSEVQVIGANRDTFASTERLADFVLQCDVIVHCAGMNRGEDKEVANTNIKLVDDLIASCQLVEHRPHIIFTSSSHIFRDTLYGHSKRVCTERFRNWSKQTGAYFSNMVLPNVFGEFGRPFYNSAVSTFCYQLTNNQQPEIIHDGNLELVYVQTIASKIFEIINTPQEEVTLSGLPITVSALLSKLSFFNKSYRDHVIPLLTDKNDLFLFNTYRSYLNPHYYPVSISLFEDNRGKLYEAIKSINGGQCFFSITHLGITRGNHYHTYKIERFLVVSGQAEVKIRKLFSEETITYNVDGSKPQYIDIPTFHTHNITNIGTNELETLFWASEIYDPENPDTFPEIV